MSEQRRIDLLFAATVRAMALARVARKGAPVAATMLVTAVAVHGTLGGIDVASVPRLAMDVPAGAVPSVSSVAAAAPTAAASSEPVASPGVAAVAESPSRPAPRLDREQENIARFIAQRYRVGLDATSEFVHHAYRAARDVKLDPMLVLAVMSVESSFNPRAQSHAGAQGLMQVLTRVHTEKFMPFGGLAAAFDPVANIRVGSAILKEYLTREGSVEGALKSYVGAALLEHDGGYGSKVLNARERIAAAAAGRPIPPEIVVAARPVPAASAAPEPTMQPVVSTIVETRTPILEEPRAVPPAASVAADPAPDAQRGASVVKGSGDI
jgi:soluble lytic murein transglycosylase-like protein